VGDAEGEFAKGGHFLGVNFLFALGDVASVGLGDLLEALFESLSSCVLLGVGKELVRLCANFASFVIGQLIAHLLDEYQQRPTRTLTVTAAFRNPPCAFDYWLCFGLMVESAKNNPLRCQRLCQ
jgi:hypothetical protein